VHADQWPPPAGAAGGQRPRAIERDDAVVAGLDINTKGLRDMCTFTSTMPLSQSPPMAAPESTRSVRDVLAAAALSAAIALIIGAVGFAPAARAQGAGAEQELRAVIAAQMAQAPANAGAYVVDLTDGHVVFDDRSDVNRRSASVMKLNTTAAALLELGPRAHVSTRVLGTGRRNGTTWRGDLYLRGGGDFTFGTAAFARQAYGTGASVERLARALRRSGLRRIRGSVFGDASLYSDNGGEPFELVLCSDPLFGRGCPYGPAGRLERPIPSGPRTPIGFNRGLRDETGAQVQRRPVRFAARGLIRALRGAGIRVDGRYGRARTPRRARTLAAARSPSIARLAALVNRPSDNYAADSLLRLIGARVAGDGSGAGGRRAVRSTIRRRFGLTPEIASGAGDTLGDRTSPRQLVTLLSGMRERPAGDAFAQSLSHAGRNGTLLRFAGSVAEGRCELKDGTRVDPVQANTVLNLAGYCTSVSGKTFAFAVMMNGMPLEFVPPDKIVSPAYALEDAIVKALAGYRE
jgi:serine-type D-Ala-D-Ala carboxypeptidase/endopeptidase (penicillin-binding protein 4)